MSKLKITILAFLGIIILQFSGSCQNSKKTNCEIVKVKKSDSDWKKQLDKLSYNVTRKADTERAFSGVYWDNHDKGLYKCIGCDLELFKSETKFESGTGWPSFYDAINKCNVEVKKDFAYGMVREEVVCARCDSHLGHVFDDGPKPTGKRYCLNSASLKFYKQK